MALACAVLCGCAQTVPGAARAGSPPPPLADLLVTPARFPPAYEAAALDPQATAEAVRDLGAVPAGATVEPADCAPPPPGPAPADAVAARGVDPGTGAALIVALTRATQPLAHRREQLLRCSSFTATAGAVVTSVETTLLPPPPVDAGESLATEWAVRRSDAPQVRMLTLVAQIDDVRVSVALMNDDPDAGPDTAALDTLFSEAVSEVRRGLG